MTHHFKVSLHKRTSPLPPITIVVWVYSGYMLEQCSGPNSHKTNDARNALGRLENNTTYLTFTIRLLANTLLNMAFQTVLRLLNNTAYTFLNQENTKEYNGLQSFCGLAISTKKLQGTRHTIQNNAKVVKYNKIYDNLM